MSCPRTGERCNKFACGSSVDGKCDYESNNFQEINTVQDLINELKKFPLNMEVRDYDFEKIEKVEIKTWQHTNYPYNLPDKDYVCLF